MTSVYKLFPGLTKKSWIPFNLEEVYKKSTKSNMRNPKNQIELIPTDSYTYGGFGEDRTGIWDGFEPNAKSMIHLGIDLNGLPINQPVASLTSGYVVHVLDDTKTQFNGWGGRVIIFDDYTARYYLYGHLKKPDLEVDSYITDGHTIGLIADPTNNGGWFPHLHLQVMTSEYIHKISSYEQIDGYDFNKLPDGLIDPTTLLRFE